MKKMLISLLALTALSISAKSLTEYDASYSYDVKWPIIGFSGATVPVKNICVDGDLLKTINPVKVCAERAVVEVCKRTKDDEVCSAARPGKTYKEDSRTRLVYGCVRYNNEELERSKFYEANECIKWKRNHVGGKRNDEPQWTCLEYKTVTKEFATNYKVEVYEIGRGDRDDTLEATKNFELPACL